MTERTTFELLTPEQQVAVLDLLANELSPDDDRALSHLTSSDVWPSFTTVANLYGIVTSLRRLLTVHGAPRAVAERINE